MLVMWEMKGVSPPVLLGKSSVHFNFDFLHLGVVQYVLFVVQFVGKPNYEVLGDSNKEGLDLVKMAIEKAGYSGVVKIGMDVAASEFYTCKFILTCCLVFTV